jgi:hypothetical protein
MDADIDQLGGQANQSAAALVGFNSGQAPRMIGKV